MAKIWFDILKKSLDDIDKIDLVDFIIGNTITDLTKVENKGENIADIAIVLGNSELQTTKARAIKAFELYKAGIVKKIVFSGGIHSQRDVNCFFHPNSLEEFFDNKPINQNWSDLTEADWGAETFVPNVFDENYQKHSSLLTEKFLKSIGVKPEDILTETLSKTTPQNALFCKNVFENEEIETGLKIKSAIIVTSCTHGSRAIKYFQKVFGDKVRFKWCTSTLDLEKYESLNSILNSPVFDEIAFRKELKKICCENPILTQIIKDEVTYYKEAFYLGEIDAP